MRTRAPRRRVRRASLRQARHVRRRARDHHQGRDAARRRDDRRPRSSADARLPQTDEERGRVADHTRMGASILEPMMTFRQFVPIVRWHHERCDGKGYPDGLQGRRRSRSRRRSSASPTASTRSITRAALTEDEAMRQLVEEAEGGAFDRRARALLRRRRSTKTCRRPRPSLHMRPRPEPKARRPVRRRQPR